MRPWNDWALIGLESKSIPCTRGISVVVVKISPEQTVNFREYCFHWFGLSHLIP